MSEALENLGKRYNEVSDKIERSITMFDRQDMGDWLLLAEAIFELSRRLDSQGDGEDQ